MITGVIRTPATPGVEWTQTLFGGRRVSQEEVDAAVAALGDGWRMPTDREAEALVDRSRYSPAIDTDLFPDTESAPYWTGTPCAWDEGSRWVVGFSCGGVGDFSGLSRACVRACRDVETKEKEV